MKNMDTQNPLFAAHHPGKDFVKTNCSHYFCEKLSIAELTADKQHVSEPFQHSHDAYEFLIPYGPIPMIMYMGAVYFGEVGYIYPVQSGKIHASKFRISGVSHDNIVIEKEYLEKLMKEIWYTKKVFGGKFKITRELSDYIRLFKMIFEEEAGQTMKTKKLRALAELLSMELMECAFCEERRILKEPWQYQQGMLSVASYMNQHYREELDIEKLAAMAGLSRNYFISSFKKFMGEPPVSYLIKLRISYAQTLLESGQLPIAEVARRCGYQKTNTFSTIFKKMTGKTPSEYRKGQY